MITGIGIDAVRISRMESWKGNPELLLRFFDERELKIINARGKGMVSSLAAHFAAKEAFAKALGTGFAGLVLKDIMVLQGRGGKPALHVEGSALEAMEAVNAGKSHISLTHEGDIAMAFVILEK